MRSKNSVPAKTIAVLRAAAFLAVMITLCVAQETDMGEYGQDDSAECDDACDKIRGYCADPTQGEAGCKCKPGWGGDGIACTNVDECADYGGVGEVACAKQKEGKRLCVDTEGSFECQCEPGYIHPVHGDPDACEEDSICSRGEDSCLKGIATCAMVQGSYTNYTCACLPGYNGDGVHHCEPMCAAGIAQRIDCYTDGTPDQSMCQERGCCWDPYMPQTKKRSKSATTHGAKHDHDAQEEDGGGYVVPPCFHPLPANAYTLTNVVHSSNGISGTLECSGQYRHGDGSGGRGHRPYNIGPFGSEICPLHLSVVYETNDRVRVRITDANAPRWEVPEWLHPPRKNATFDDNDDDGDEGDSGARDYTVSFTNHPFGFSITRISTQTVILNTTQVCLCVCCVCICLVCMYEYVCVSFIVPRL
jgi:hypothetical protein